MSEDLVRKARELDKKATKGPWSVENSDVVECSGTWITDSEGNEICDNLDRDNRDAEFIAEIRNLLPALAEALEASMKREERMREEIIEALPSLKIEIDNGNHGDIKDIYEAFQEALKENQNA